MLKDAKYSVIKKVKYSPEMQNSKGDVVFIRRHGCDMKNHTKSSKMHIGHQAAKP